MKRQFVIGDIHGAHKALLQCLEKSGFDYEKDELISLGDVADGWNEVPESFDELLKIKNLVYVIGNHDLWLLDWFESGRAPHIWLSQGGKATWDAYKRLIEEGDTTRSVAHENLLKNAVNYYEIATADTKCIVTPIKLFVHGGFNWHVPIDQTPEYNLVWDRNLWTAAKYWQRQADKGMKLDKVDSYDEVFIGHTSTSYDDKSLKPVHASNVWNLDQGAGWEGKLTIMNIDTKEYWQSDIVGDLYPDVKGRRG